MSILDDISHWNQVQTFLKTRLEFYEDLLDSEVEPRAYVRQQVELARSRGYATVSVLEGISQNLDSGMPVWRALSEYMPPSDIAMLSAWETRGKLLEGIQELVETVRQEKELKQQARSELLAPVGYLVVALALMTYGVPWMVGSIGSALLNPSTMTLDQRMLVAFSGFMSGNALLLDVLYVLLPVLYVVSLPRWTGRVRQWLDNHFVPYSIYRSYHAALFLKTLATQLTVTPQMHEALNVIRQNSNRWLAAYILQMQERIPFYRASPIMALDVGLLDVRTVDSLVLISQKGESEAAINARAKKSAQGALRSIRGHVFKIRMAGQLILGVMLSWAVLSLMTQPIKQQMQFVNNPAAMNQAPTSQSPGH